MKVPIPIGPIFPSRIRAVLAVAVAVAPVVAAAWVGAALAQGDVSRTFTTYGGPMIDQPPPARRTAPLPPLAIQPDSGSYR